MSSAHCSKCRAASASKKVFAPLARGRCQKQVQGDAGTHPETRHTLADLAESKSAVAIRAINCSSVSRKTEHTRQVLACFLSQARESDAS